jgi:murein tripeptide amidase MpaA
MIRRCTALLSCLLLAAFALVTTARADIPERDRYHTAAQMESLLKDLVGKHKAITKLHSFGKSYEKRDLWVVEVTDFSVGKPEEKPGVYLNAAVQGDEPGGSEVALQILAGLLDKYGKDMAVTDLLKTRTLYFMPRVNPDGVERAFAKIPWLHKMALEPFDADDEEADKGLPSDVDADGNILKMRIKDPEGEWRADTADKRTLVRRKPGEIGEWRLFPFEGVDADGNGLLAGAATNGTNLNRNFPALWDWRTKQPGAGPFMASAQETVAVLEFLIAHPNIALVETLHVTGAQPFYPAGRLGAALAGQDKAILDIIGKKWEETTGNKLPTVVADPADPGAGTFLDWSYLHFGALSVSPEIWNAPKDPSAAKPKTEAKPVAPEAAGTPSSESFIEIALGQGRGGRRGGPPTAAPAVEGAGPTAAVEKAWLDWNDRELTGSGFVAWHPFKHPQLGDIEIGGWKPFTRDNPPVKYLAPLAEKELSFFLSYAAMTPLIKITDIKVESKGGSVYQVLMTVTNTGATPTASGQGILNRQTRPVLAILDLPGNAQLISGIKRVKAGHLAPSETKTVTWTITAPAGTTIKLTANAQRGGTETKEVVLR